MAPEATWVIPLCLGILIGWMVTWWWYRRQILHLHEERVQWKTLAEQLTRQSETDRQTIAILREQITAEQQRRVAAETQVRTLREAEHYLRDTFQALAAEALTRQQQSFLEQARQLLDRVQRDTTLTMTEHRHQVEQLIGPIRESLEQVRASVETVEKQRIRDFSTLRTQIEQLMTLEESLRKETERLVRTLHHPTQIGVWGEIHLQRLIELAGMDRYCDFSVQETLTDTTGERKRPDVIIRLPNDRVVPIDVKVPITSFVQAMNCSDETERQHRLREHVQALRSHIRTLSERAYWRQFSERIDFVIMYLPVEGLLQTALKTDPDLLQYAFQRNVILATPSVMMATLRAIAYGWQERKLAENARRIEALGQQMYDRLVTFTGYLTKLGERLRQTVEVYNDAVGSFERRLIVAARRFLDLGVGSDRVLSEIEPLAIQVRSIPAGIVHAEPVYPMGHGQARDDDTSTGTEHTPADPQTSEDNGQE